MKRSISVIAIGGLIFLLGCPSVENANVEHRNVCIDLSPDGENLVFSSADGDLYLFDISESTATRLTDTDRIESYPSFSPDGKQITFAATETDTAPSRMFVSFRQACNFSRERVGRGKTRGEGRCDDGAPREVQQLEAAGTAAVSGDAVASVSR